MRCRFVGPFNDAIKCVLILGVLEIGVRELVLVDGNSKRSSEDFVGRTDGNKSVTFSKQALENVKVGDYVEVEITEATRTSLKGIPMRRTTLQEFYCADKTGRPIEASI